MILSLILRLYDWFYGRITPMAGPRTGSDN